MVEKREGATGLVVGGVGGTVVGTVLGLLLASKPAEAAPPEAKWDYLVQCQEAIIVLLQQTVDSNATMISLLQQLLVAQGVLPEGVAVTVQTKWIAQEPEVIFDRAITSAATFNADKMVNWTRGKRLIIKVESLLDQDCDIQVVGNIADSYFTATDIPPVVTCLAHGNTSIGLAWDDWFPFIGVRITTAVAPTSGLLTISAVVQE